MAQLRYRSTGPVTRSNQPASKRSTGLSLRRPKTSTNQEARSFQNESDDEIDFEPDLNELFIQSIEELLPEREQNRDKSATPTPHPPLQRSAVTPDTPIKVEKISDFLTNLYDASPQDHVYKTANLGRRQTSRSTAQLTTPSSSPERKLVTHSSFKGAPIVKSEVNHESDGRQYLFSTVCSPPLSSPEESNLSKRSGSKRFPTPERPPLGPFRALPNNQDLSQSSSRADGRFTTTILPERSIVGGHNGLQMVSVSGLQPYAVITKVSKPQHDCKKSTTGGSLDGKSHTAYPPILPPPKIRPMIPKITTPTRPTRNFSALSSTSEESLPIGDDTCRNAKDVVEEIGRGPREKRSYNSRMKSLSACPSSVSSFGLDEDIPCSGKMHREVGRAITESAETFASGRMSELSPSLKYSDLLARLGINHSTSKNKEEVNHIYNDFEDSLTQNNLCRVIFGKAGKDAADYSRTDLRMTQRSCSIEGNGRKGGKRLQRIPSRSLRSFSVANPLSKSEKTGQERGHRDEPCHDSVGKEIRCTDEDSGSEYDETLSRKASTQLLKVNSTSQSKKRARGVIDDWQPRFSDDEDMVDEDDIVEINRTIFEISENRRKKRHESKSDESDRDSTATSQVPKEEPVEGNVDINLVSQDCRTAEISCKDNTGNAEQGKSPCDYYMNTYWDHGRASDGHRARDGFISYLDFKEYCRKNKQPIDDRCMLTYKKDLKHHLRCEYHASQRQDLFRVAWNFEYNPGFSFKSCSRDEETRRLQNEAIGNAPSPGGASGGSAAVADGQVPEVIVQMLKVIGTSHTADVAQLTKSKKKLESEVRGLKRHLARIQKR